MKNRLGILIVATLILFCFSSSIKAKEIMTAENIETTREPQQMTEKTIYYTVTFIDEVRNTKVVRKVQAGNTVQPEQVSDEYIFLDKKTFKYFERWTVRKGDKNITFDFDIPIGEDLVLYAYYPTLMKRREEQRARLDIEFDSQGGTKITTQFSDYNQLMREPEQPYKEGYKFLGWYTKAKGGEKWNFKKDKVIAYMTLYAHWEYVGTGSNVSPQTGYDVNIAFEVLLL